MLLKGGGKRKELNCNNQIKKGKLAFLSFSHLQKHTSEVCLLYCKFSVARPLAVLTWFRFYSVSLMSVHM